MPSIWCNFRTWPSLSSRIDNEEYNWIVGHLYHDELLGGGNHDFNFLYVGID